MIENGSKESILTVLNWIFGILFLLFAATELLTNTIASFLFFLGSLLLIPTTKKWIERKFNHLISWQVKTVTVFFFFIAAISFVDVPEETISQHKFVNNSKIEVVVTSTEKTETDTNPDVETEEKIELNNKNKIQDDRIVDEEVSLYTVVSVVDGDTIDVNINGNIERLRLIGLNTPETVDPRKPVECFGKEASEKAKQLLLGKSVRLEADETQQNRDIYERLLRYVFLEDGTLYNKYMIEQGYAYEYTYNVPYIYQSEFKAAQRLAEQEKRGLWVYDCDQFKEDTKLISETPEKNEAIEVDSNIGFYTSSHHSAKLYYCAGDPQWKQLSERYLTFYETEASLLERYPEKTLHEPCSNFY